MRQIIPLFTLALIASGGTLVAQAEARAQESPVARATILKDLVDCRTIAAPMDRLACFDAAAAAFDSAESAGTVVVVDSARMIEARRQMFGFEVPSLSIFGRADPQEEDSAIETTLIRVVTGGDRRSVFTLADGSVWRQVDSERANVPNRMGSPVRVRRASMGSYLMTVDSGRGIRVRREQ